MENRVCSLFNIKYPIVSGGMVWCSGWRLASAVSKCGGLGLLGAGSMHPDNLRYHIRMCRENLGELPFGVNVPLLYPEMELLMKILIEEKVKIVFTSAGSPKKWTPYLKEHGIVVCHVVSSALFAEKCEKAGVDAVPVAVGVLVLGVGDVGGVGGLVGLEQALGGHDVIGVGGAAKPDVAGGVAVLLLDLGLDLTGGEALVLDLDAKDLLEVVAGGGEVVLLAGAVDNEGALLLGGLDEVLGRTDGVLRDLGAVGGGVAAVAVARDEAESAER